MSTVNHQLKNRKVLVTGVTGFIGSHLARRLHLEEAAIVTGSGRRLEHVPNLAKSGITLSRADLADAESMRQLVVGQDFLFHLAWAGRERGAVGTGHQLNIEATANLIRAAAAAGVQRFIFASSINAYGPPRRLQVDETHPLNTSQRDAYGRTKALAELKAAAAAEEAGIELVIVRPAMVYGPGSSIWTVQMLEMVQKGVPVIYGKGDGYASPLYIDNLVDGLLLTAVMPDAAGEAFNFCDAPVDWHTFFGYYSDMCGRPTRSIPLAAARLLAFASEKLRLGLPLTRERLEILVKQKVYPVDKAQRLLGYRPRFTLDQGMRESQAWLLENGYLDKD